MKNVKLSNAEIRKYLGHNLPECRVRIHKSGDVSRYGSTDLSNRSLDFWILLGNAEEISDQILKERHNADEGEEKI